jgi:hypothetical protein
MVGETFLLAACSRVSSIAGTRSDIALGPVRGGKADGVPSVSSRSWGCRRRERDASDKGSAGVSSALFRCHRGDAMVRRGRATKAPVSRGRRPASGAWPGSGLSEAGHGDCVVRHFRPPGGPGCHGSLDLQGGEHRTTSWCSVQQRRRRTNRRDAAPTGAWVQVGVPPSERGGVRRLCR